MQTRDQPRIGDAVAYGIIAGERIWLLAAQVIGFYEPPRAGSLHPAVSLAYYDPVGIAAPQGYGPSRGMRRPVGMHYATQVVHRDHWIGDAPDDFWIWPEEGVPWSPIQVGGDRLGMGAALDRLAHDQGVQDYYEELIAEQRVHESAVMSRPYIETLKYRRTRQDAVREHCAKSGVATESMSQLLEAMDRRITELGG